MYIQHKVDIFPQHTTASLATAVEVHTMLYVQRIYSFLIRL